MLVLGHMLMCRLVDDRLATEERRLAGPQDRQEDQTDQDQPETQDQHQADTADAGTAAVRRICTVAQGDDQNEEQPKATKQWEQELEEEVEGVSEELVSEEPDAAESGQPVIETDHDA